MSSPLLDSVAEICRVAAPFAVAAWIQSALPLALGLLLGTVALRGRPLARSAVYRAALLATVAAVLGSFVLAGQAAVLWRVALPATAPTSIAETTSVADAARVVTRSVRSQKPRAESAVSPITAGEPARSEPRSASAMPLVLTLAWLAGSCALLGWLATCYLCIFRLRRQSRPLTDSDAAILLARLCRLAGVREPELLLHPRARAPFLTGPCRPAILLPADYTSRFDSAALDAVLTHEVTHLARRDLAWHLAARVVCAIGWVQPLLWVLCRKMEQTSEEVCDRAVTEAVCPPREYARFLLRLAEQLFPSSLESAAGLGLMPFRSSLGRRIQQIVHGPHDRMHDLSRPARAMIGAGAAALSVAGACLVTGATPALPRPLHAPIAGPGLQAAKATEVGSRPGAVTAGRRGAERKASPIGKDGSSLLLGLVAASPRVARAPGQARATPARKSRPATAAKQPTAKAKSASAAPRTKIEGEGIVNLRDTPAGELARIGLIRDVGLLILDETQKGKLRARMEDVGKVVYLRRDAQVTTEPLFDLSRAAVEAMPRNQRLAVIGIVLVHPDVTPELIRERFADLHVVGILIAPTALRAATLGTLRLDGVATPFDNVQGPIIRTIEDLKVTSGYLEQIGDGSTLVSIGDVSVEPGVTEDLLKRKIRAYYGLGDTSAPTALLEVMKALSPAPMGEFTPAKP